MVTVQASEILAPPISRTIRSLHNTYDSATCTARILLRCNSTGNYTAYNLHRYYANNSARTTILTAHGGYSIFSSCSAFKKLRI